MCSLFWTYLLMLFGVLLVLPRLSTLAPKEVLDLSDNRLVGQMHDDMKDFVKLCKYFCSICASIHGYRVELSHIQCMLTRPTFPLLLRLASLSLKYNKFDGTLPTNWEQYTNMGTFNNDRGSFVACTQILTLPWYDTSYTKTETLNVQGNDFSGTIPSQWSAMTNLKTLNVGRNEKIIGEIPSFLGTDVKGIQELDFHRTGLTGMIPTALEHLSDLKKIYLHETELHGHMPDGVCIMRPPHGGLQEITADCAEKIGTVKCHCCTECFT